MRPAKGDDSEVCVRQQKLALRNEREREAQTMN
jgi:hypothetical protein